MGEGLCLLNGEGRSLPAPRAEPAEPHPTLGAFFASGSNAPNPLAGDWAAIPAMKIHGDLHFHFAFHRGIGAHLAPWGAESRRRRASRELGQKAWRALWSREGRDSWGVASEEIGDKLITLGRALADRVVPRAEAAQKGVLE